MEEVFVTKYKSLNGSLYETKKAAMDADTVWIRENDLNIENELKTLTARGSNRISAEKRKLEKDHSRYPMVVIEKGKHAEHYWLASNPDDIGIIMLNIIKANNESYYYSNRDAKIAEEIIKNKNQFAAITFIQDRAEREYEEVIIENMLKASLL